MTDQYSRSVDFAGGASGGGAGFTLGPTQNVFTGANRTAAESARDAYAVANPSWLVSYNTDTSLNIRLEYTENSNPTVTYQVRNTAGNAWLDNESFEGVQGQPGAGTDFGSITLNHIPAIGPNGVPFDSGVEVMGDTLVTPKSLQVGLGTVLLGQPGFPIHAISSVGENVVFANRSTNVPYTPGSWSDGSENTQWHPFTRVGGTYFDDVVLQGVETDTLTNLRWTSTQTDNRRDYDFTIRGAAAQTNVIFRCYQNNEVIFVSQPFDLAVGDTLIDLRVASDGQGFLDLRNGVAYDFDLTSPDGDVQVLGSSSLGLPYVRSTYQLWEDVRLSTSDDTPDGVTAEINGRELTITLARDSGDLMTTVTLPQGGTTPAPGGTAASITRFEIAGQSTSVLAGTTLSGTQTFNYNVNHPEDVNGNLSLVQNGVVLRSDISPSSNSFTQAITSQTLQNNQQAVFELRGVTNENIAIQMFFRVRAHLAPEQLFYGLSATNNAQTIDVSNLNHIEAGVDGSSISTGTTAANNYFIVLVPSNHDLTSIIDGLGQNVTNIFTRTENIREISSVQYHSYVFGPVNAGASESYTLRF